MTKFFIIFVLAAALPLAGCGGAATKTVETGPSPTTWTNKNTMPKTETKSGSFTANLPKGFTQPKDEVSRKLLGEYGSVFVARGGAVPPKTVVFKIEAEVTAFQKSVKGSKSTVGGVSIELQLAAMNALTTAAAEAAKNGLSITPHGSDSAKRSYADTVGLWKSRVEPGLVHWVGQGKITAKTAALIRGLSPYQQVAEIFKLEAKGIFFAKDLSKTIIYSVAPPGTSQHLSMLALDVAENENEKVREILAKNGWFQTVISDLPHFTFLGVNESGLPALGLKKAENGGRVFWVPDI